MRLKVLNGGAQTATPHEARRRARGIDGRAQRDQVRSLAADLQRSIEGEVRFDSTTRALYANDGSNYRHIPLGVVVPRTRGDVAEILRACREHDVSIVPRGAGTSLAGQTSGFGVVIDFYKHLNRLLEIDPDRRLARVEPGCRLDRLNDAATARHQLRFPPDPSTHVYCSIGGMLGNNACGVRSIMHPPGRTSDFTEAMEVMTYDGARFRVGATSDEDLDRIIRSGGRRAEIYRGLADLRDRFAAELRRRYAGPLERRGSGFLLNELLPEKGLHVARSLVGTEGTCAVMLEATVQLVPWPRETTVVVLGYPDVYRAAEDITRIREFRPMALEGMDDQLVTFMTHKDLHLQHLHLLPEGKGWLIAEFGADTQEEADDKARAFVEAMRRSPDAPTMETYSDRVHTEALWEIRESGLAATAFAPQMQDTWTGWEDSAVPPARFADYLRDFRALLNAHGYACSFYGHFGQGLLHCRVDFDLTRPEGLETYRRFRDEAADLVARYGGSFSGEHGDGQSRAGLLEKMYGPELVEAHRRFKSLWDPRGRMNPGKVIDPYPLTQHLRLGADYRPMRPRTHFQYPEDQGRWDRAVLRCVGVGKCLRERDAFMCPSYQVTLEEKHTTRGRARALFEMTRATFIKGGWKSEEVKETLDLCLSCKACKSECPVNVDIATYKSEFMAHYWHGRLRPRSHWSMGLIGTWARLASLWPAAANFAGQTEPLSTLAKRLGGIAPERRLPEFAAETFTRWYRRTHRPRPGTRGDVVLWPDVFTDHFHPRTLRAMTHALERLNYTVLIPPGRAPAIRPLIHYGMLRAGKRHLLRSLRMLAPLARRGARILFAEPSTASVFRDDLRQLLPNHPDTETIRSQTCTLGELLENDGVIVPKLHRRAILHGHCHDKAVLGFGATRALLKKMAVDAEEPEPGCCGMAGSFGFEAEHSEIAQKIGERALLPAIRRADPGTLIIADGFSCREQIRQNTGRRPLHLAELVLMALDRQNPAAPRPRPEPWQADDPRPRLTPTTAAALSLTGVALLAATALTTRRLASR